MTSRARSGIPVGVVPATVTALVTIFCQLYLINLLLLKVAITYIIAAFGLLVVSGIVFAMLCTSLCRRLSTDRTSNPSWLHPTLKALAVRMQMPEPELHTLDTAGINAFAVQGIFDNGHILINTATLTHLHEDEIEAVLAHECSHIRCHHALVLTLIQGMSLPITIPAAVVLATVYGFIFGMENFRHLFLTVHQLLTILLFPLTSIAISIFTRIWEFDADRQAAEAIGVEKYIAALKCLHGSFFQHPNLLSLPNEDAGQVRRHRWALSHPSISQRIHALLEIGQPG